MQNTGLSENLNIFCGRNTIIIEGDDLQQGISFMALLLRHYYVWAMPKHIEFATILATFFLLIQIFLIHFFSP